MPDDPQKWKFRKGQKIYLVQEDSHGAFHLREFTVKTSFNFFGPGGNHHLVCDPPIGGTYMVNRSFCPYTRLLGKHGTKTRKRHPPATPGLLQLVGLTPAEARNSFIRLQMEMILGEANERMKKLHALLLLKDQVFDGNPVSDTSLVANA